MKNFLRNLISKASPFIKTDAVYVAKGGFWLSVSHFFSILFSLALYVALAHFLTKDAVGTYKYVLSLATIVSSFTLSGLASSVTRSAAHNMDQGLIQAIKLNVKWAFLLFAGSGIGALYYFLHGNNVLGIALLVIGIGVSIIDTGDFGIAFGQGKKAFSLLALLSCIRVTVTASSLIIVSYLSGDPLLLVLTYFISHSIMSIVTLCVVLMKLKKNTIVDIHTKSVGFHVSISKAFGSIAEEIDSVFVHHTMSGAALATYNFAQLIPGNVAGWIKNIGTLAMPKFVGLNKKEARYQIIHKSMLLVLMNIVIATGIYIITPFVFAIFFPQYPEAVFYAQILSIGIIFSAAIPLAYLDAHVAIKEKYAISIVSNIVKVVLLIGGIYLYGLWGAVIARLISKIFGVGTAFYYALLHTKKV